MSNEVSDEVSDEGPPTSMSAAPGSTFPRLQTVTARDPLRWLGAGWRDFIACPVIGLFFGACFVAMGLLLSWTFFLQPAYVLALSAGFLLTGPFLCLGLYEASRRLEAGERPTIATSLVAWRANLATVGIFCAVLLVLEMLWSRTALVVFAVAFNRVPGAANTLEMLLHPSNIGFLVTYLVVGAVFAILIFATTVVSMPMLVDRTTDAITAAITSFRACLTYPAVLAVWALLIAVTIFLAMLPAFAGLLVAAPVVGHATWHAYRAIVARPGAANSPS